MALKTAMTTPAQMKWKQINKTVTKKYEIFLTILGFNKTQFQRLNVYFCFIVIVENWIII